MTGTNRLTDLGQALDVLREEALRRLLVIEGRRRDYRRTGPNIREYPSTDELVARVESHADLLEQCDANGWKHPNEVLGDWCRNEVAPSPAAAATRSTPRPGRRSC